MHLVIVLLIFSLTGFTSVYVSGYLIEELNLSRWSPGYILGVIFIITPVYLVLLLFFAAIFGKFRYFLNKQVKIVKMISRFFKSDKDRYDR